MQSEGFRFRKHSFYKTKNGFKIRRFLCLACGSSFSRNAFCLEYFLKRPELLRPVAAGLQAGSAHRQLARSLGCAPSTVTRLAARLGRHAILVQAHMQSDLEGRLEESVVVDPFETFELTQDFPFGVTTAVGSRSWLVYDLDPAPHARTGRRTAWQERRRKRRAPRPRRGGYTGSYARVLERLLRMCAPGRTLELIGDGDPALDRAVKRHADRERIRLRQYPNPPRGPKGSPRSREAIARDRAMFPGDTLHMLLRHSAAAHRRETIAFGKRLNAIMERLPLTIVWRNLIKGVSERRGDRTTPAMRAGLTDRPWSWERLLGRRLFPKREQLRGIWLELYRRDWVTAELGPNTRHRKVFAY